MDHIAAAEERLVTERLRRKLNDVSVAAQTHLSPVTDYVNFTLQQAYFKCAHECFDRRRKQEEIGNCVDNCSIPVMTANNLVENEMAKFQYKEGGHDRDDYEYMYHTSLFAMSVKYCHQSLKEDLYKERLSRSMVVCQDKFETATKFQQERGRAMNDMESCVDHAIQDSIQMLPHVVNQLKASLSINEKF